MIYTDNRTKIAQLKNCLQRVCSYTGIIDLGMNQTITKTHLHMEKKAIV